MSNRIRRIFDVIVERLWNAAAGAAQHVADIVLKQNTQADILGTWALLFGTPAGPGGVPPAVIGLKEKWNTAKAAKVAANTVYQAALLAGRSLAMAVVGSLKPALGTAWNSAWNAVGFTNSSLAIPENPSALLDQMGNFLESHPTMEVTGINGVDVTAATCRAAALAINNAQTARNAARGAAGVVKVEYEVGLNAGLNRLIGVRTELGQLLPDDDKRWLDFGFVPPAFMASPGVPEDFVVIPALPGTLNCTWKDAKRADSYRLVIEDAASTVLSDEIVWNNEHISAGLTSGMTVNVKVSARNITGESAFTAPVTVVVP